MTPTVNFGFLILHDPMLVQLGGQAERYFKEDPAISLFKLRQFAELLSKIIAARHALYRDERETFEETLRKLSYARVMPKETADVFHFLRKVGNSAVHEAKGTHAEAMSALKFARQLGIWFHRTYGKQSNFNPGGFIAPPEPSDDTAELRAKIVGLELRIKEVEAAAAVANKMAADKATALETAEERLKRQTDDQAVWESLAQELENDKVKLVSRLFELESKHTGPTDNGLASPPLAIGSELSEPINVFEDRPFRNAGVEQRLSDLQAEAEKAPITDAQDLVERGLRAAAQYDLDESATRALIDQQLRDREWEVDSKLLRYGDGTRPSKGRNLAIAEWPTESGPADYALFCGLTLVGVVEAKRNRKNVSAAIDQAERYSAGLAQLADFAFAGGPWGAHRVPFVFSANGRSYLKQIETESGIWFRDTRRAANHRRALVDWPTPEGLTALLAIDQDAAAEALRNLPFDFGFPLRDYQQHAIEAVEKGLEAERRTMLLAMATGTGKTKLAIAMLYRLLATKRFHRICFVVDRSALGHQAAGEFSTTKIVSGRAFADIFGLKKLEDITPDSETKVHICTIQGLVKRVLFTADDSEAPPIDQYDLIVVDECHRGYLLDRESALRAA
ncbi:DEAD/DEAH box helicase family protein [Bradyrhizobium sp. JYMT SZCCT0428]|uniref:DEAD/DEAH box helicase family protein n=1 Tax=Bradyrhizobium sp. JYMT SZCCT0428 TaxID=2807673 RepID=UPI0020114848|nr:DEAD/DEAH box helicase family protein [Bradyrhizobium sp. JYMT SZCCT0428]